MSYPASPDEPALYSSSEEDARRERARRILDALRSPARPLVTYALFAANVAVFLVGLYLVSRPGQAGRGAIERFLRGSLMGGGNWDVLYQTGALHASDVLEGRWWRLLSCCFVHDGLLHLGLNMYMLYSLGPLLERMWGRARFLVLYLIAGLGGSCAAMIYHPGGLVGASGAIWGAMASMLVWVVLNRRYLPPHVASSWLRSLVSVLILNVLVSFLPGVSAAGHFGGGAAGAVCAVFLNWDRFGALWQRVPAWVGVAAVPGACLLALYNASSNPDWKRLAQNLPRPKARDDVRRMEDELMPRARGLEKEAEEQAEQSGAEELLMRHPRRRDPNAVPNAVAAYARALPKLAEAADLLRGAGPFQNELAEKARVARLELLEARHKLYEQNQRCLEHGEAWSEQDEKGRQDQDRRVAELEKRWASLLR